MNNLTVQNLTATLVETDPLAEAAEKMRQNAKAQNTRRAYDTGINQFLKFLKDRGYSEITENVISEFLTDLSDRNRKPPLAYASIKRALASVSYLFRQNPGYPNLTQGLIVTETIKGILREIGGKQKRASAVYPENIYKIESMLLAMKGELSFVDIRNLAIVSLGFAVAGRISEISNLSWSDIRFNENGTADINIIRSKTDQAGLGKIIQVKDGKLLRPVSFLKRLKEFGCQKPFPLVRRNGLPQFNKSTYLSKNGIAMVIKDFFKPLGIENVSGHSLRAGYITWASEQGVHPLEIARVSGHKNLAMLNLYNRSTIKSRSA